MTRQAGLFHIGSVKGSERFEQAWASYPPRHVSENKRDALREWTRRLKEGSTELEMLEGAERYALFCEKKRIYGTEYVMQPRRFFGPSRHYELEWRLNGSAIAAREQKSADTMARLRQNQAESLNPEEAAAILAAIRKGLNAVKS